MQETRTIIDQQPWVIAASKLLELVFLNNIETCIESFDRINYWSV